MKKLSVVVVLLTFLVAGAAAAQHRKPAEPSPPQQPPPQAQPKEPQKGQPREPGHEQGRPPRVVAAPPPILPWWWDYPYGHGYPPYGINVMADWEKSGVRLDVQPEDAQVFVDRYYAGVVDDFNGIFERLTLSAGPHLIEVRKTGYVSLAVEVSLYPGQTITYQRKMEPSRGDENAATVAVAPAFEEGAFLPPQPADPNAPPGDLKFDVTPEDAAIYADGFYVGIVDDFNGGQHMRLTQGRHHLMLTYDGYETLEVDVMIDAAQTITYRAKMKKSS